ncbi:hypothetical protein J6590_045357 [Homalodisca vitripennis]|nr:hypothetical protein J6590_045357 [Homalodisca vitripennis]
MRFVARNFSYTDTNTFLRFSLLISMQHTNNVTRRCTEQTSTELTLLQAAAHNSQSSMHSFLHNLMEISTIMYTNGTIVLNSKHPKI